MSFIGPPLDLNGSIKSVEEKTVSLFEQTGKFEERLESTSFYRYDKSKNLIEWRYLIPGKTNSKTTYLYNEQNQLIKISYYESNLLINKLENSYNRDGLLIERRFFDNEGNLMDINCPTYTREGLRTEDSFYEPFLIDGKRVNGTITFSVSPEIKTSFSNKNVHSSKAFYDAKDKLIEISFYNRKGKLTGKTFVKHNRNEKPIKITTYGDDRMLFPGELKRWQKALFPVLVKLSDFFLTLHTLYKLFARREFKKAGRCLIYGTPFDQIFFTYGEKDKIIKTTSFSTLTSGGKAFFKYDENGNRTEEISYFGDSFISHQEKSKYKYDLHDNWVEKKTFYKLPNDRKFMERTVLTYRTIEYYSDSDIRSDIS